MVSKIRKREFSYLKFQPVPSLCMIDIFNPENRETNMKI